MEPDQSEQPSPSGSPSPGPQAAHTSGPSGRGSSIPPEPPQVVTMSPPRRKYLKVLLATVAVLVLAGAAAWVIHSHAHKKSGAPAKASVSRSATAKAASAADTNKWKGSVDPAAIPLGDGKVSTAPKAGYVDSCTTSFRGGGAQHAGSWLNTQDGTWDSKTKAAVQGSVHWPAADYTDKTSGNDRVLTTNDLPEIYPTGTFPIAVTDPAYQYDRNPNHIGTQNLSYTLPLNPVAAAQPSCTPLGPIGILSDGVTLFNALDAGGRDAVAHETQDKCNGHPNGQEMYHYHDVASCIRDAATGSSTLVGYALDGYGIYVERDSKGNLPTDADLDACHGRTSEVAWNGRKTDIYHYDATLEYPYTVGCFHGTPVVTRAQPR